MTEHPKLIRRKSRLVTRLLPLASKDAVYILQKALEEGLNELRYVDPSQMHTISAQFWINSRAFFYTDVNGTIFPATTVLEPQEFYPSYLINASNVGHIRRQVNLGHLTVVAYKSLVPYLLAGGEASVDALARELLDEAVRVVDLGLPTTHETLRFLDSFCAFA